MITSNDYIDEIVKMGRRFIALIDSGDNQYRETLITFLKEIPEGKSPYYESDEFLSSDVERTWRNMIRYIDGDNGYTGFMMSSAIRFAQHWFRYGVEPD